MLKVLEPGKSPAPAPADYEDYAALYRLAIAQGVSSDKAPGHIQLFLATRALYPTHEQAQKLIAKWEAELADRNGGIHQAA